MKFLPFSQTKLGSSFDITRARVGGASVIPLLLLFCFLHSAVPPKSSGANPKQAGKKEGGWGRIFAPRSFPRGKAEGGFGGNSAFPLRNQNVDSPATCPNTWRQNTAEKYSFH